MSYQNALGNTSIFTAVDNRHKLSMDFPPLIKKLYSPSLFHFFWTVSDAGRVCDDGPLLGHDKGGYECLQKKTEQDRGALRDVYHLRLQAQIEYS